MSVSSRLVIIKVSSLSREIIERVAVAQYCSVRQFIKQHRPVPWMGTHILQLDPRKLDELAAAFMEMVHTMVAGPSRDTDYLINMYQSMIPFTLKAEDFRLSRRMHCPYPEIDM